MTLDKQIDINMKTGISKLFVASIAALLLGVLPVFAGGEFETKKYKISDFRHRTTYVVLSGNAIVDAVLRSEFQRVWTLSPYEFSTIEDFNVSKKNPESYFLLLVDSRFRNERHDNGIMDLSLFKGDPAATGEGVEGLYHVASMPLCAAEDPDGRELIFLPCLINILQQQILNIMDKDFNLVSEPQVEMSTRMQKWDKRVAIAVEDMAATPSEELKAKYSAMNVDFVNHSTIEDYVTTGADALVGYVVAPNEPQAGASCYCMIIDASKGELLYIVKRAASLRKPKGFIEADLVAFSRKARKK